MRGESPSKSPSPNKKSTQMSRSRSPSKIKSASGSSRKRHDRTSRSRSRSSSPKGKVTPGIMVKSSTRKLVAKTRSDGANRGKLTSQGKRKLDSEPASHGARAKLSRTAKSAKFYVSDEVKLSESSSSSSSSGESSDEKSVVTSQPFDVLEILKLGQSDADAKDTIAPVKVKPPKSELNSSKTKAAIKTTVSDKKRSRTMTSSAPASCGKGDGRKKVAKSDT